MKPCLKLLLSLPDSAQEAFAQRVERGLSLGASQEEAKREASRMLMDDLKAEAEMVEKALREQHPEVFAEPAVSDPANPDIRKSRDSLGFYSELEAQIEKAGPGKADAGSWRQFIGALSSKGVKADEVEWSGVNDWLSMQQGKVSKQQVLDYLKSGGVRVQEVVLGGNGSDSYSGELRVVSLDSGWAVMDDEDRVIGDVVDSRAEAQEAVSALRYNGTTKYERYTLPGGENYREVLLTLPVNPKRYAYDAFNPRTQQSRKFDTRAEAEAFAAEDETGNTVVAEVEAGRPDYRSNHWEQPNIVAHIRLNGRRGFDEPRRRIEARDDVLPAKVRAQLPLDVVQGGVLAAAHDDHVRKAVVAALPVDVVDALRAEKAAPEDLFGNDAMRLALLPSGDGGFKVLPGLIAALRRAEADVGAKVRRALVAGLDEQVLPALRTSDFEPSVVRRLLASVGIDESAESRPRGAQLAGAGSGATLGQSGRTGTESNGTDGALLARHADILIHRDRTDAEGKRVLFVEEVQSDWGQEGKKKGFARKLTAEERSRIDALRAEVEAISSEWGGLPKLISASKDSDDAKAARAKQAELRAEIASIEERAGIQPASGNRGGTTPPAAPFVTKTDGWLNLALKRILAMAVDGGYDKVAFVTGEQSAERYDLSKQVDSVHVWGDAKDGYYFEAKKDGRNAVADKGRPISATELADTIGKELADQAVKLVAETGEAKFSGDSLRVGGAGMKSFYNAIVPNAVKALAKKVGGVVEPVRVQVGETTRRLDPPMMGRRAEPMMSDQPGLTITDAMRAKVEAGLPRFSRDEGQFELPEFGPGSRAQLALQDRYNRWKQAVQAVREQGGNVNEYNDFYLAEERYWGRVGAQNEAFGQEVEDFVEAVKKDGLTLQDVAEYVYAKHAAERNAYVAKMRDDMEGTGSGMTDEEADSILIAAEQSGLEPLLMKHAEKLYEWIDGTRQVMLENGLISDAEANSWEGMFTHYVPLRGLEGKEPQGKGTGSGFNIKGRESKQITGRRSKAKQIIEQIIQDRTKAYIRAGKNEVLRTFLNFALENPSPNLWKVSAVETKPTVVVDEFGNRTVEQREMLVTDPRRVVSLKDGGQTIHIEVKDQELLKQLQNGYATTPIAPVAAMLWANRTVGAMLTAFSPVFVAMNAVRDAQTAFFGMIGVKGYKGAGNLALQYPAALREAFKAHFGEPSAEYREYLLAGGTTGYFGLKELDETGEELAALVRRLGPLEFDPKKPLQFAGDAAYKLAGPIAKFVENVNGVVEQTTRFAAYRAAKRSGSTVAESASISKNLTVNFNRKGSLANFTGAAVLFFNPAVQGTARLAQAMKSPKVWGALGGAAAGVFFLALANADLGGEDDDGVSFWDKVPREVKERNLVIMRPPVRKEDGTLESRYIKIPVAYGYNVFLVAAYEMADALRHRDDKTKGREPMESASRVATAFLGATLPVQALGQSLEDSASLTMAPYSNALGPVAQALANKSGFGRPLYPETQNTKYLPDSQKFSVGQAGTIFQKAAEKLNEAAGGDKFTSSGWLTDIAPGSLENAARFYGGGLTSMTLDIMNAFYVRQHIERPEPDLKRLPFVKQFYGSINDETDRWFAYERMNKAERATQPLEAAIRAGDAQAVETILKREPLAVAGKALDQIRQSLSDIRKAELAIIQDPDLRDGERYIRLMEQSKNAREVLRQWNTVYDDLNKRQEPAR